MMQQKQLKRGISLLMVFFLFCANACFAAETTIAEETEGDSYHYALSQCISLGILQGDGGNIRPDSIITRAEAVTAVIRILSMEETAEINRGNTGFKDVPGQHWASGYVNTGFIRGIVNGKTDNTFDPDGSVTRFQLIKMLVCALGYGEDAAENGSTYPESYLAFAQSVGLIDEVIYPDEPISRGDAAQLLYDALYVPVLDEVSGEQEELAVRFGVVGKQEDPATRTGKTYYLSPAGDDEDSGSEEAPWKTLSVASRRLAAGDTLILEDGEYHENTVVTLINGGRKDAPITITARNKHGAKIIFGKNLCDERKILVDYGQDYVTIQNLEITQEVISKNDTFDIFIAMYGDYNSVLYNKIYYGYEEGIKSHGTKGLRVIGNEVDNTVHEAIDAVNIEDAIIANNRLTDWGRVGIMLKGGSRNIKIYNNYIETNQQKDTSLPSQAIGIGGSTDNHSGFGSARGIHEAYNYVVWNNIIYCPTPNLLDGGLVFTGAKDCVAFNNVVYGAKNGMRMYNSGGTKKGWEWDPENVNPVLYNNIFVECSQNAYLISDKPHNVISDYNLFYKTRTAPVEAHSIYSDPKFLKSGEDFRLREDSPARGAGRTMETSVMGFYGEPINLDLRDFAGNVRKGQWSMGAYVFGAISAKQATGSSVLGSLMADGFDYANTGDWAVLSGDWEIADGILSMTGKETGRSMIQYTGGLNWTNYTFEADVQVTDAFDKERCSGLLFRGDVDFQNVYALRFNRNDKLELCKWSNGVFSSIKKWKYQTIPDEVYRMKVVANGSKLSMYVNDELIDTIEDSSYVRGTVGLYAFYAPISIDNVLVTSNSK